MVKVTVNGKEFYIDGYLKENLDRAKEIIKKDWDMIFLYDGYEGSGKSVKAMQDAYYCDPTFDLDRVTFNPKEFTKAIKSSKEYQSVIYDEAYTGLSSRAAMSLINRTLVKMLAEIRQKKLFVFIVMPTFFDVDKYVALWRSRALIHVYTGDNFERGFFSFYNMERKKDMYVLGKKFYNYFKPSPNFRGRFMNTYVVDEDEYRKKKKNSLLQREDTEEQKLIQKEVFDSMFAKLATNDSISNVQKAKILGISDTMYYYYLQKYNKEHEYDEIEDSTNEIA